MNKEKKEKDSILQLIPAIDLYEDQVVRLVKGDYQQMTLYGQPAESGRYWLKEGADRLHVVDLEGAREGKLINLKALESIISTGVQVQFGGGIRSWQELEELFELGIRWAILGTAAVKDKDLMIRALNTYKERIILALDSKNGRVSVEGWLEDSDLLVTELLAELSKYGLRRFIYTDTSRDGTLQGPNITGAIELCQEFPQMKVIISGGVSSLRDLQVIKEQTRFVNNLEGIISGKALYEGIFSLQEAVDVLTNPQV